jgi:Mor family transcriptional regulator
MGYKNVNGILPHSLIRAVQQYIDGEYVYIPRKETRKRAWGTNTGTKQRLLTRNREIIAKRQAGSSVAALAEEYFLSTKAIYKIINTAGIG